MFSNPLARRFRRRHNNNTAENNNDNPCGSPPSRQPPPPEQAPPPSPSSIRRPPPLVPNTSPSSSRYLSPATEAMLHHHHGNHSNSKNNNDTVSSQEEELQHLDRDGHLEELRHIWKDYVQERERQVLGRNNNKDNDPAELVLAEVELNRTGVKYLMEQAQVLLLHAANGDDAILPTRLLLNSCRYRETDQTAHLLVRGYLAQCLPRLQLLRLEAAYVGHLPQATAECLLQGLLAKPSLQHLSTLQLVDWDLRPPPVADKLAALLSPLSELSAAAAAAAAEAEPNGLLRLETLELRHCRVTPHTLTRLGHALTTMSPAAQGGCYNCPLQRLTLHACVLDDALLDVLVRALKRGDGGNGDDETCPTLSSSSSGTLSHLRHLALPSNRLTVASLSNLAKLLDRLPHLQTLNVERISRLFFVPPPPPSNPDSANHDDNDIDNRQDLLETGVALFSTALSNHTALQLLDLTRCGATDLVANALFRSLPDSLQELRLGGNDLTMDTAVHELSGLRHLQRLELPHAALDWYRGTNDNDDTNSNIGSYKSALAQALHQNTSLTSILCDGTLLVDALPVMHRNHYLRHVQTLMMLLPPPPFLRRMMNSTEKKKGDSIPATTNDDINNNDNINPSDNVLDAHSPLWPHALHACRTAEGSSARYAVLQMHAVHWAT